MLRDEPNYTIAAIAEESGFTNIRMLQRRIQDAIGMSPVDYRLMLTRDLKKFLAAWYAEICVNVLSFKGK